MKKTCLTLSIGILLYFPSFSIAGLFSNSDADECEKLTHEASSLAENYCEKAAKSGDVRSQKLYAKQLLAKKDYEQAKYWFEEAAKKKDGEAVFQLGELHRQGQLKNSKPELVRFYYKTACDLGEISACAEIDLLKQKDAQIKKAEQEKIEKKAKDDAIALEKAKVETLKAEQAKIKAETEAKIRQLEAEKKKLELEKNQSVQIANQQNTYTSADVSNQIDISNLNFREGLAKFKSGNFWGYVDTQGNVAVSLQFLYAANFYEGLAAVRTTNNQWGFIDKIGRYAVAPKFACVWRFSEGVASVNVGGYFDGKSCKGGKWGLINKQGTYLVEPILDNAEMFRNGTIKITYQGVKYLLDHSGNYIQQ